MDLLNTLLVLCPILFCLIRNERRLSRIETHLEWLIKKNGGSLSCKS